MESERPYTVPEVAKLLRLHEQTIRDYLRKGLLKGYRPGGTKAGWRIPASELERFARGEHD
jgi:excisionase family DNA binding protein